MVLATTEVGRTLSSFQCQVAGRKEYDIQFLLFGFNFLAHAIHVLDQRNLRFDKGKRPVRIQCFELIEERRGRGFRSTDDVYRRGIGIFCKLDQCSLSDSTCPADEQGNQTGDSFLLEARI